MPESNDINIQEDEEDVQEIREKKNFPCYTNIFDLDLVLIGHDNIINELFYLESRNLLFSSSHDYNLKIWDIEVYKINKIHKIFIIFRKDIQFILLNLILLLILSVIIQKKMLK